jgi:hypothetical protein
LFFLASASPNDNDSEEYGKTTTNGVIKLRLMSAERPVDARVSAVKCSLICDPKVSKNFEGVSGWTWLDKNIKKLSVCERLTVDGERAIFVVASVTFGFSVWVITHAHFKDMATSPVKISPFKCALPLTRPFISLPSSNRRPLLESTEFPFCTQVLQARRRRKQPLLLFLHRAFRTFRSKILCRLRPSEGLARDCQRFDTPH